MIEPVTDLLDRGLELLNSLDPVVLVVVLGLFTALETTALIGTVIPGDAAVLLAGSTADTPGRFAMVLVTAATGTYTGELIGYAIGRGLGPRLRLSRLGRRIGEHRWARTEAYLAGQGAPVLIPIRFVSVLHAVAPVVAGTVRMRLRRFAFWAGMGALIWATTFTAIGAAAGTAYRQYGHLGLLLTLVVGVSAGTVLYLRRWWRRRRGRGPAALPPIESREPGKPAEPAESVGSGEPAGAAGSGESAGAAGSGESAGSAGPAGSAGSAGLEAGQRG